MQYAGLIFVLPIAALASWTIVTTIRALRGSNTPRDQWMKFFLMVTIGMGLGIWFSFFVAYQPAAEYRVCGFPVPTQISQFDGDWRESRMPALMRIASHITDLLFGIALGIAPAGISIWIRSVRENLRNGPP